MNHRSHVLNFNYFKNSFNKVYVSSNFLMMHFVFQDLPGGVKGNRFYDLYLSFELLFQISDVQPNDLIGFI